MLGRSAPPIMKEIIAQLDPAFDHRNRLGLMSVLVTNERVEYSTLKALFDLTDGNLASHLRALETAAYIAMRKQFMGRKPHTSYEATEKCRVACSAHLNALEALVRLGRDDE